MIRFGTISIYAILIGVFFSTHSVPGQQHRLIRGDMAPGMIAFRKLISNPNLQGYSQPVRIVAPEGSSAQILSQGGFGQTESRELLVGLQIGPVYRLRVVTNVRGSLMELYPSIEVVDRLYPPEGLRLKHPVRVVISQSDIEKAIQGNLVTKVVYLEDPDSALPFRQADDDQSYFDISFGEDSYTVADRLGRPMAIIRMGSRMPGVNDMSGGLGDYGGSVELYDARFIQDELNRIDDKPDIDRKTLPAPTGTPTTQLRSAASAVIGQTSHSFSDQLQACQSDCSDVQDAIACPPDCTTCAPVCIACGPARITSPPPAQRDEYVCDGNDRNGKVIVDQSNNLKGLDIEDTIGHFETRDGRRMVAPSNRVCIYAPGFAAVRKVTETGRSEYTQRLKSMDRRTPLAITQGKGISSMSKQNLQLRSHKGSERASGFRDLTRGASVDNTVQLTGTRSRFKAFEDFQFTRFGKYSSSESARLGLAIQSAVAWNDNLSAQITVKGAQPIIVNDVYKLQEIVGIKAEGSHPTLRLCKLASKISARRGDIVDFTIRFDNFGRSTISNVTIIDNLSPRLEFVAGSAECTVDAEFQSETNEASSLTLKWTISQPLDVGEGGLIRFQCTVR